MCSLSHPSIHPSILTLGEGDAKPGQVAQFIVGLTYKDKQKLSTFTLMDIFRLTNKAKLHVSGLW